MKRGRTDDGNSYKGKFEGKGRPRFKKRFSNQGSSSYPRINNDRVPNPSLKKVIVLVLMLICLIVKNVVKSIRISV